MATKLLWTGLTITTLGWTNLPYTLIIGSIFMIIGALMLWLDSNRK